MYSGDTVTFGKVIHIRDFKLEFYNSGDSDQLLYSNASSPDYSR